MRELSLHILDILENALEAGATLVNLDIEENSAANLLSFEISDNGRGMDAKTLEQVQDPFFTTRKTRRVGLGIPLLRAAAERCGGELEIQSQVGLGTRVHVSFELNNIDRAPLGDMFGTLMGFVVSSSNCDLVYHHQVDDRCFEFNTREIRSAIGERSLAEPCVRSWLRAFIAEGLSELYGKSQE